MEFRGGGEDVDERVGEMERAMNGGKYDDDDAWRI